VFGKVDMFWTYHSSSSTRPKSKAITTATSLTVESPVQSTFRGRHLGIQDLRPMTQQTRQDGKSTEADEGSETSNPPSDNMGLTSRTTSAGQTRRTWKGTTRQTPDLGPLPKSGTPATPWPGDGLPDVLGAPETPCRASSANHHP
jgi:hypothetical protein